MKNPIKIEKSNLIAVLVIIAAIFIYTFPLLCSLGKAVTFTHKNYVYSWHGYYFYNLISYAEYIGKNTFPVWVPFSEGGNDWNSFICNYSFSPFTILLIIFGVIKGLNLSWYILYFAGALSMFYLTRSVFRYNIFGAVFSSLAFSMCGFFPVLQSYGLLYARTTLLLPILVAFYLKAVKDTKYIFFAALIMSAFFFESYLFLSVIVLFMFLIGFFNIVRVKNVRLIISKKAMVIFALILFLFFLYSAYRIFPMVKLFTADMRISSTIYKNSVEANTLQLLLQRFVIAKNLGTGSMYFGYAPLLLCVFSGIMLFKYFKRWLFILIIFLLLSLGQNSFLDLHSILWHLPVFKSITSVEKYYGLIIVFLISLISGGLFWVLEQKITRNKFNIISITLIVFVFLNLLLVNTTYFRIYNSDLKLPVLRSFTSTARAINLHKGDEGGLAALKLALYLRGIGMTNFYHAFNNYFDRSVAINPQYFILPEFAFLMPSTKLKFIFNPAYEGEAFFLKEENKVESVDISSRSIDVLVDAKTLDTLVVNQNYDKEWKSESGIVLNSNGLLSVQITHLGEQRITFYFNSKLFWSGMAVTMLSLLGSLVFIRRYYYKARS